MPTETVRSDLIRFLKKKRGKPVELKELKSRFGKNVETILGELERDGTVVRIRRRKYAYLPDTAYRVGRLRAGRKSSSITVDSQRVTISAQKALGALDGDLVVVQLKGPGEGNVVRILERRNQIIPGFIVREEDRNLFRPYRRNLPLFRIEDTGHSFSLNVTAYRAEITIFPHGSRQGVVRVQSEIGEFGDVGMEARVVYADRGWDLEFPDSVLREADTVAASSGSEERGRVDLRDKTVFTIDGEDARDFDDALSLETTGRDSWILGVHIADVSHYVREGSELDSEAYRRATSTYFPDWVVPMLPEVLSNGTCSLVPQTDRLTVTLFMNVDRSGRISRPQITPSVIRSNHRMTYTQVQDILDGKIDHPLSETLQSLNLLAKKFYKKRKKRGSLDFDFREMGIVYDSEGRMVGIRPQERLDSHRLIEECMITANQEIAKQLGLHDIPFLYRIHETPDRGRLMELQMILEKLGISSGLNMDELNPLQIQNMMSLWKDLPEAPYLDEMLLRTLARARYSPDNLGHFGLASSYYCHFTSPIRRYPDLIVHRMVKRMQANPASSLESGRWDGYMKEAGEYCSKREWEAETAEREVLEWKSLQLLENMENTALNGKVSGVLDSGIFVTLPDFNVQGFIPFSSVKFDYLKSSIHSQSIQGTRTSLYLKLGDDVPVTIIKVDLHRRVLELGIRRQS